MHNLDRTPIIIAAAATGTAAVLVFALLPVLSGALADEYQLDDVQTGLVATSYFSVYALIALTSSTWKGASGKRNGAGICPLRFGRPE